MGQVISTFGDRDTFVSTTMPVLQRYISKQWLQMTHIYIPNWLLYIYWRVILLEKA